MRIAVAFLVAFLVLTAGLRWGFVWRDAPAAGRAAAPAAESGSAPMASLMAALSGDTRERAPAGATASAAPAPQKRVYYQWVDSAGSVNFATSLGEVPPEWRK